MATPWMCGAQYCVYVDQNIECEDCYYWAALTPKEKEELDNGKYQREDTKTASTGYITE